MGGLRKGLQNLQELIDKKNEVISKIVKNLGKGQNICYCDELSDNAGYFTISRRFDSLPWKYGLHAVKDNIIAIQNLQAALDEHHRADEHVIQIKQLYHRLHKGRNSFSMEKQIIREIKSAEERKEKLTLDFEAKKRTSRSVREFTKSKKMIKDQKEILFAELKGLRKQQKAYSFEAKHLKKILEAADKDNSYRKCFIRKDRIETTLN